MCACHVCTWQQRCARAGCRRHHAQVAKADTNRLIHEDYSSLHVLLVRIPAMHTIGRTEMSAEQKKTRMDPNKHDVHKIC